MQSSSSELRNELRTSNCSDLKRFAVFYDERHIFCTHCRQCLIIDYAAKCASVVYFWSVRHIDNVSSSSVWLFCQPCDVSYSDANHGYPTNRSQVTSIPLDKLGARFQLLRRGKQIVCHLPRLLLLSYPINRYESPDTFGLAEYQSDDLRPPAICLGWSWTSLGGKILRSRGMQLRLRPSTPFDGPACNLKVAGRIFPLFELGACCNVRRTQS